MDFNLRNKLNNLVKVSKCLYSRGWMRVWQQIFCTFTCLPPHRERPIIPTTSTRSTSGWPITSQISSCAETGLTAIRCSARCAATSSSDSTTNVLCARTTCLKIFLLICVVVKTFDRCKVFKWCSLQNWKHGVLVVYFLVFWIKYYLKASKDNFF